MNKFDRMEELIKSSKSRMGKAKEDLKAEYELKKTVLKENKELQELEKTSPLAQKYNRKIQDCDNRIEFHKNTMRYTIEDVINHASKMNKEIEPFISCTDKMAEINITFIEEEKAKINKEIENTEKQIEMYPEYNRLYTEEGKKEYANLESKIVEDKKKIDELEEKVTYYKNRDKLMKKYKENLNIIKDVKKIAKDNMIDLNDKSFGTAPATPGATPATPGATPVAPATPGATPAAPATPGATPATPGATPVAPVAPATPGATPATPGATPATPGATPVAPATPGATLNIKVGRKVKLEYKKKNVGFSKIIKQKELKDVVKSLDKEKKIEMIKDIIAIDSDYERQILDNIDKIDDAILYTLSQVNEEAKQDKNKEKQKVAKVATEEYIQGIFNKKLISGMNIQYDRKDLSRGTNLLTLPIIKRFTGKMTREQKDYINQMSEISEDFTTSVGIYEKNPFKRFLQERKQGKIPANTVNNVQYKNDMLDRLKGYRMAPDPDKNKSVEQIQQENAKAKQRQVAINENSEPER